ncbi:MAG: hypothetical protein GC179_17570 [Anaerolineaceae bacterium]|nr:hypothetical protein [Anaerolineaceae bacterium]
MDGQDNVYKDYFLDSNDPISKKLLDSKWYGHSHLKCMSNWEWGSPYYKGLIQYSTKVMSYRIVNQNDWLTVLYMPNERYPASGSLKIVRSNGWYITIDLGRWWLRQKVESGCIIAHEGGLNFDFSENLAFAQLIRENFLNIGTFPLQGIIDALEINDEIMDSWLLQDILIKPKHEIESQNWIVASFKYYEFVPKEIAELVPEEFTKDIR